MVSAARPPRGRRLLVVAPNWLGDLIMATPALARLAAARTAGWSTVLSLPARWAPLFTGDPRCDEVLPWERHGRHGGILGVPRLAALWRAARADAVVLMPPSLRVALAARLAGIPLCVGLVSDGRRALLTHPLPRAPRGARHFSLEMLDLAEVLLAAVGWRSAGGGGAPPSPSLPGCAGVVPDPRLAGGPPVWALGVGATFGDAKSWPPRHLAAFAAAAAGAEGVRVLLLGEAAARPAVAAARAAGGVAWRDTLAGGAGVVDLVGRTSLPEVVALLRGCALYVGNDSGLMHLAAALGTPTVGLFGSTNPDWTAPRGARVACVAAEGFPCSPCYLRRCPQPLFCLETVTPEMVLARVRVLLTASADREPE
jgi:heptosyltransferase-2